MVTLIVALVGAVLLAGFAVVLSGTEGDRRGARTRHLQGREPIALKDIYSEHYAAQVRWDDFLEVWTAVAKLLHLDPQLLPTDTIANELRPPEDSLTEDEIVDVHDYLKDLRVKGRLNGDLEKIRSMDDIARALTRS